MELLLIFVLLTYTVVVIRSATFSCPTNPGHGTKFLFEQHCYEFVTGQHVDWTHANADCIKKGGWLTDIHSASEQEFILNTLGIVGLHGDKGVWIGFNDRDMEGTWIWTSGTNVNYRHWAAGQPGGLTLNDEDCALLDVGTGGDWHDYPCEKGFLGLTNPSHGWICKFSAVPVTYPSVTTSSTSSTLLISSASSTALIVSTESASLPAPTVKTATPPTVKTSVIVTEIHVPHDPTTLGTVTITATEKPTEVMTTTFLVETLGPWYYGITEPMGHNKSSVVEEHFFGFRGRDEHPKLRWGDTTIYEEVDGTRYLMFEERDTKTRKNPGDLRLINYRLYETKDKPQTCPVNLLIEFTHRRPLQMCKPEAPFYLQVLLSWDKGINGQPAQVWFKNQPLGEHSLGNMMKDIAEKTALPGRKTNHSVVVTRAVSFSCPSNPGHETQFLFEQHCYEFVTGQHVDWTHANADCIKKGGWLTDIHSASEQAFILNTLRIVGLHGDKGVWIGFNDRDREGTWIWTSGTNVNYKHWAPGQPGGLTLSDEDCALLDVGTGGYWHDYACEKGFLGLTTLSHGWICKFAAVPVTSSMMSTSSTTSAGMASSTRLVSTESATSPAVKTTMMATERPTDAVTPGTVTVVVTERPTEPITTTLPMTSMVTTQPVTMTMIATERPTEAITTTLTMTSKVVTEKPTDAVTTPLPMTSMMTSQSQAPMATDTSQQPAISTTMDVITSSKRR